MGSFISTFTAKISLALLCFSTLGITGCNKSSKFSANAAEQPTLGDANAPVHVVVFEEPKCPGCKKFTTLIFPLLKQDYIDTKQVRFSVIPVSFVPKSMPAAEAWLCVYHQEGNQLQSDLAFKFIDYTYANQPAENTDWATVDTLVKFAKETSPSIDLEAFKKCLEKHTYQKQVEKNTEDGMNLMEGDLGTPSIFINGVQLDEVSYDNIEQRIKEELNKNKKT